MKQYIFVLFFAVTAFLQAQTTSLLSGTLVDADFETEPLAFAEVFIKETGVKTFTDSEGVFSIETSGEEIYTLVFSFTGYEDKEVIVDKKAFNKQIIKVSLQTKTISFEDLANALVKAEN